MISRGTNKNQPAFIGRSNNTNGSLAAPYAEQFDTGLEHILSVRALLRAFSLSPEALQNISPCDHQNVVLHLLSEVEAAYDNLSALIPQKN